LIFRSGRARAVRLLAGLLLLTAGCARRGAGVFPRAPVLVISVDTLRADHLPAYGYRAVETPNLDALARDSVVFDNAISHVPLTLPSHVSLWTGLLPFQHGVRDNVGYRVGATHPTLAAFLRARGYATGAAVSAFVLDHASGVAEGFDFYDDRVEARDIAVALGRVQRPGGETEALLEGWIGRQNPDRPIFAFLHLYEPHTPYEPPEPFRTTYRARPYDGEIAASDVIVGRFIAFAKARGLFDRAIVVLLSDHGEGLGEHGEDEHGILLYREALRVPLFIKLPGSRDKGRRLATAVGLTDVFPTIASLLGEKAPEGLAGRAVFASDSEARSIYSETLYPRYHFGWSDLASLTDARYHYIAAPRPELFDWTTDPSEQHDLSGALPPAFRSMRLALEKMERPLQPPGSSDPETVRKLASLGYIGASSAAASRRDLPDPKDRIHTLDRLKDASRLVSEHREDDDSG
jgi:arylsulfatase A-like enzyme